MVIITLLNLKKHKELMATDFVPFNGIIRSRSSLYEPFVFHILNNPLQKTQRFIENYRHCDF